MSLISESKRSIKVTYVELCAQKKITSGSILLKKSYVRFRFRVKNSLHWIVHDCIIKHDCSDEHTSKIPT
jgi:hypothetical protein